MSDSAHWYTQKGEPAHDSTLRDARKLNLLPSVTSILKILDKPQLTSWRVEQGIMAALTLPQKPGEPVEDFARRVVEDASAHSKSAAEFGTEIHTYIEQHLATGKIIPCGSGIEFWPPIRDWLDKNVSEVRMSEKVVVDLDYGYAGRLDLVADLGGRLTLIDFKTQGTKPGKAINKYPEWAWQLAAMYFAVEAPIARWVNVVISSSEEGRIEVVDWSIDDIQRGWKVFVRLLELWRLIKKFEFVREQRVQILDEDGKEITQIKLTYHKMD